MRDQCGLETWRARLRSGLAVALSILLLTGLTGCSVSATINRLLFPSSGQATTKLSPKVEPPAIHEAGKLCIGVNLGMAPFAVRQGSEYVGFDIDVGRTLAKHLGLEPIFVAVPPDQVASALENNTIDLALSVPVSASGVAMARTYYLDAPALFAPSEEASHVAAQTQKLPLTAVQEGSAATALLTASLPSTEASATLQVYPELKDALQAVEDKKAAAVAGDYVILRYAQVSGAKISLVRALSAEAEERGVAIRADNLELMRSLKPILDTLDASGAFSSIMGPWIGVNQLKKEK